jgi:hypothetical protein
MTVNLEEMYASLNEPAWHVRLFITWPAAFLRHAEKNGASWLATWRKAVAAFKQEKLDTLNEFELAAEMQRLIEYGYVSRCAADIYAFLTVFLPLVAYLVTSTLLFGPISRGVLLLQLIVTWCMYMFLAKPHYKNIGQKLLFERYEALIAPSKLRDIPDDLDRKYTVLFDFLRYSRTIWSQRVWSMGTSFIGKIR